MKHVICRSRNSSVHSIHIGEDGSGLGGVVHGGLVIDRLRVDGTQWDDA